MHIYLMVTMAIALMFFGVILRLAARHSAMKPRQVLVQHVSPNYAHARLCLRRPAELRNSNVRFVMDVTLWQLKEQMSGIETEIRAESEQLISMSASPSSKMEDVRSKKARLEELRDRYAILKGQHDQMVADQAARMQATQPQGTVMTMKEASGLFYRAALSGNNVHALGQMAYQQLGAIPADNADQGNGSRLLPTNLSNELLTTPLVENPLSALMTRTQITGLEVAPLNFELDDDDFVADGETAKELEVRAEEHIVFGRNELRLVATISDTILRGTPLSVESAVSSALQSKLALKELKCIFTETPDAAYQHMSLYANNIKEVTGTTMLDAILAAYGDLEDFYRPNATCVMRSQDYFKMLRDMNGSENFFGKKPEDVIGIPVTFCERATYPVVGAFKFLHENFDIPGTYDTEREARKGLNHFVVANWFDIQIKMQAAFRIVKPDMVATVRTPDLRLKTLTIGTLVLTPAFADGTLKYKADTTNATDVVTATAFNGDATVAIKNGSTAVTSGQAATWAAGANALKVSVTAGGYTRTYNVTVTKS